MKRNTVHSCLRTSRCAAAGVVLFLTGMLACPLAAAAGTAREGEVAIRTTGAQSGLSATTTSTTTSSTSSTSTSSSTTSSSTTSTIPHACGDGAVQVPYETCDDGNDFSNDACVHCRNAFCGDGYQRIDEDEEQCDDGNGSGNDGCVNCHNAFCGDFYVHAGEEECDHGPAGDDGCSPACCGECGDPNTDGEITAADALVALRRAVGLATDRAVRLCDVNGSGEVTAIDALAILRASVDLPAAINCGPSPEGC